MTGAGALKKAWLELKTRVQAADGNCHQAISHLGQTHMPLEAFVLATHRRLSAQHPLSVLVLPHFEGTLAINESANLVLLAREGGVDMVMSGTIESSRALAGNAASNWDFNAMMLPTNLASRGVIDVEAFPNYPYRDDGLLVYTKLGHYPHHEIFFEYFGDRRITAPVKAFHAQLAVVEQTITERNIRRTPYVHLLPSQIPQSINI